ncbi:MAG: class I SAM-dependent methyltransferase [Barnesiella intestinihominis]
MDYKAEGIKPYDEETDKTTQVREMFDSIAPAYDTMNRTMTLGIDRWWRRVAVRCCVAIHRRILDMARVRAIWRCCWTARLHPDCVGVSICRNMFAHSS